MIGAFIIDDEPLAVAGLTALLDRFDDVEIVGTANNGQDALPAIQRTSPGVLFVDIEMPGMDGFDFIEAVGKLTDIAPLIVFVTAFPKFAVEAFDTGAVDFVTKPVRFERLAACVDRVRTVVQNQLARNRLDELVQQLEELRNHHAGTGLPERRFLWVHRRGELIRLDLDHLDRVSAEGEYVRLFTNKNEYLHRASISAMVAMLNPQSYVRVHRSHIVRIGGIVAIARRRAGGQSLLLESGANVPVGRLYRHAIRELPINGREQNQTPEVRSD